LPNIRKETVKKNRGKEAEKISEKYRLNPVPTSCSRPGPRSTGPKHPTVSRSVQHPQKIQSHKGAKIPGTPFRGRLRRTPSTPTPRHPSSLLWCRRTGHPLTRPYTSLPVTHDRAPLAGWEYTHHPPIPSRHAVTQSDRCAVVNTAPDDSNIAWSVVCYGVTSPTLPCQRSPFNPALSMPSNRHKSPSGADYRLIAVDVAALPVRRGGQAGVRARVPKGPLTWTP
jgi:hypothetical protein